jgi:Domain of unknown function (DUF4384)
MERARCLRCACVLAAAVTLLAEAALPANLRTVEVSLERSRGNTWTAVDPQTVFASGDQVRFRFQASFSGFLYVLDQPASGDQMWLFPTQETGSDNAVQAGREYLIPATEGGFRIPDRPGYDTVFWIVSETPLTGLTGAQTRETAPLRPLLPRCRDAVSHCIDDAAGARPVTRTEMPGTTAGPLRARDVTLNRPAGSAKTNVSVQGPGPVIYEIRVAHR